MNKSSQKTAIVTGASRGLGIDLVNQLLDCNYRVYGISRSNPEINNKDFVWLQYDLSKIDSVTKCVAKIPDTKIDILINNAGLTYLDDSLGSDYKKMQEMLNVNLVSPVLLTIGLLHKLTGSQVINISSIVTELNVENYAMYSSSKSGLRTYFNVFATNHTDIKVLNILPDMMNTPMLNRLLGSVFKDYDKILQPKSVAGVITRIALENKYKSGNNLVLTNSWLKRSKDKISTVAVCNIDTLQ